MRKTLLLALVLAAVALSPLAAQCESDDDCDDGVPCTVDTCGDGGECAYAPACDDGLDCTVDICEADGSCENRPIRAMCQPVSCISGSCEPLTCVTGVCSATAPVPGPGQRVLPGGVSGCFRIMDDDFCADTWDGCACNGIETCSGTGANTAGCSAAPRTSWPCEGAPAGDGNACTEENCCEPWNPAGCRLHRALQAAVEPDEVPQLRQFCDAVEDSALSVTTPNGSTVQCTTGDARFRIPAVDPVIGAPVPVDKPPGYWCDNCNPCDIDSCNPATGACNRSQPLPDGTQIPQPAPSPLDPPAGDAAAVLHDQPVLRGRAQLRLRRARLLRRHLRKRAQP